MNEKKNNKQFTKVMILVISLMVLAFSGTYAYYTNSFIGKPNTTKATSGVFKVTSSLEKENALNNTSMNLINEEQIEEMADSLTFTITSLEESTVDGEFSIYLKDVKLSKNLYSEYLNWELLDENGEILYSGDFAEVTRTDEVKTDEASNCITDVEEIKLNEDVLELKKNTTLTFTFRMYLLNDPAYNQIELTSGSFNGRLYIEAIPVSNNTEQDNTGAIEQP